MTTALMQTSAARRIPLDIPDFCFLTASVTVILGMSLGLYMGVGHDYLLQPVHVHMNVIGWLGLFMIGLYYRAHPAARGRLAVLQAGGMAAGHALMVGGLAALLLGQQAAFVVVATGGFTLLTSMILFLVIAARTAMRAS
jgi:hypothetical protein